MVRGRVTDKDFDMKKTPPTAVSEALERLIAPTVTRITKEAGHCYPSMDFDKDGRDGWKASVTFINGNNAPTACYEYKNRQWHCTLYLGDAYS